MRERGKTPLYVACENGHAQVVDLLLSRRADPNANVEGKTPIMAAAEASAFRHTHAHTRVRAWGGGWWGFWEVWV